MAANKLVIAVLTGVAAGFVVGMLVAPEKGSELRKKISDVAGDLAEKLIDMFATGSEDLLKPGTGDTSVDPREILG